MTTFEYCIPLELTRGVVRSALPNGWPQIHREKPYARGYWALWVAESATVSFDANLVILETEATAYAGADAIPRAKPVAPRGPWHASGLRVDLNRSLPAGVAAHGRGAGGRTECARADRLGLPRGLQCGPALLGPDQRPLRSARPGGGGARHLRAGRCGLCALDDRRPAHPLACGAGSWRERGRRPRPRHGTRPL